MKNLPVSLKSQLNPYYKSSLELGQSHFFSQREAEINTLKKFKRISKNDKMLKTDKFRQRTVKTDSMIVTKEL